MCLIKSTPVLAALAVTVFTVLALAKKNVAPPIDTSGVATITQMENASVKADLARDSSYVEKNYADSFLVADRAGETGKRNSRS
jgi:ethanolamine utilization microcompartment shell protein EutS